uniref:Small ribosomal subunit protein uS9c n=1 Tax=Pediastrum duplex TaxID=3105 RepID=A0A2U8GJ05_PEDDU|nr:ribosomal protein S9 [Pediastrum duplex]
MSQQTEKMEILVRAVGRRKEAVAQVKIVKGTGKFLINKKPASDYLHNNSNSILSIQAPFEILQKQEVSASAESMQEKMQDQNSTNSQESSETTLNGLIPSNLDAHVKVEGGGLMGQTEAIRLAVARAVCEMNGTSEIRKNLKDKGYLTQDSRIKERRKYGLRKARKAPQYNKR